MGIVYLLRRVGLVESRQQDWNRYLLRFEELRELPLAVSWIKR